MAKGELMCDGWPAPGGGLNDYGGNYQALLDDCYRSYYADFYSSKPAWPIANVRFAIKRQPEVDGQCHTFWHIISEGRDEENRTPDFRRCERITWPRLLIDEFCRTYPQSASDRIVWWKVKKSGEWRYCIALPNFSYLVVVAERAGYVLLWTAYPVDYSSQRSKLSREYVSYWGNS
jgi:hypothetical protein